jgi:hypothetical protein
MFKQKFVKPALLVLGSNMISGRTSDHSRQPLSITFKRIETSQRMANGTLRKYYVATKNDFSVSWDFLPNSSEHTVDGFMGADEITKFYETNPGAFDLTVVTGQLAKPGDYTYSHPADGPSNRQVAYAAEKYKVHFSDFSLELAKRGHAYDMYNVSLSMEEI